MTEPFRIDRLLANEDETRQLAMDLAMAVQPHDIVTLEGDLGSGKSTLARALIRAIAEDDRLEVPSPTFALVQPYDLKRLPVVHADLYRVSSPDEIAELGWDEVSDKALLLVEWPARLGGALSGDRLEIELALVPGRGPNARSAVLTGHGAWAPRLAQGKATLYKHALEGFQGKNGVMPAKGGRTDASDDLVKLSVDYMIELNQ